MATIATDNTKAWSGEPAAIKGLIVSVITTVLAIVAGTTTPIDGADSVVLAVVAFVAPLLQGFWTRRSVTPVSTVVASSTESVA